MLLLRAKGLCLHCWIRLSRRHQYSSCACQQPLRPPHPPMFPGSVKINQNKQISRKFLSCAGFWTSPVVVSHEGRALHLCELLAPGSEHRAPTHPWPQSYLPHVMGLCARPAADPRREAERVSAHRTLTQESNVSWSFSCHNKEKHLYSTWGCKDWGPFG